MNGSLDVGIAVGIDPGLKEADRLQVHEGAGVNNETAKMLTLKQLYNHCSIVKKFDKTVCEYAVLGVYAALEMGIISEDSTDVVRSDLSGVAENHADILIKGENLRERTAVALTLLVATKATWWATNHHLGDTYCNKMCGRYLLKVIKNAVGGELVENAKDMCYLYGHSCSTRNVLAQCGIAGVVLDPPVIPANGHISVARDAKLRFSSFPAGTHRLTLCAEILERMWGSTALFLVPSPSDFSKIAEKVEW